MSLVPLMFRDWWDDMDISRPSRLIDQHFGIGLNRDDLLSSMTLTPSLGSSLLRTRPYFRPWRSLSRQDSGSTVTCDKDKFEVILDVQQFNPSEITVKTNDQNTIIVEGKHEEKKDEHGFISRHFIRKYMVPTGHDVKDVISSLSSDGILTITAPKKALPPASGERIVNITQTGPARQTPEQPIIEHVN